MRTCSHLTPFWGSPEAEPKELQLGVRHSTDLRLLFVEFQEQLSFNIGFKAFKGTFRRPPASAKDHHVVRIANEAVPPAFKLMIELVEHDVGEDGADRPSLRSAYLAGSDLVVLLYRRTENLVDERDHSSVSEFVR